MTTGGQQNRAFLRIPVSIPASIYLNGQFYKKLQLADLSAKGLSFFVSPSDDLPDFLAIRFKLTPFSKPVNIILEVKNRVALAAGVRIGCAFFEISDPDKRRVDHYVCNFVGVSFPVQAVNLAAFLCAVDASLRLLLYVLNSYYSATDFGRSVPATVLPDDYGLVLAAYVSLALLAFISSSPAILRRGRLYFISGLLSLGCIFLFLLFKNFSYWKIGLWNLNYPYANIFLTVQLLLVAYLGFSIMMGIGSLKKIAVALGLIERESAALGSGLEQLKSLRNN